MELIYLRGSPWSVPLIWGVYKSGNQHLIQKWTEHMPIAGDLYLRWKIGTEATGKTLSVPVLLDEAGRLAADSSLPAAKRLCSAHIYPPDKEAELQLWNSKCDSVRRFGRGITLQANDNMAEKLIGRIPLITPLISRLSTFWLKRKYAENDLSITKEEAVEILLEMANVVKKMPYFLGTNSPTYLDFSIAVLLEMLSPEYGCTIASIAPNAARMTDEILVNPNRIALEPLFQWKKKIFKEHFFSVDLKEMRKRLELPGFPLESLMLRL